MWLFSSEAVWLLHSLYSISSKVSILWGTHKHNGITAVKEVVVDKSDLISFILSTSGDIEKVIKTN